MVLVYNNMTTVQDVTQPHRITVALFFQALTWLSITLAMIGKFFTAASFAIIYMYTAEMFPTSVRAVAVGSGSLFARAGAVVAPYVTQLVGS